MFNKKEITAILIMTLIFAFAINPLQKIQNFLYAFLAVFFVIIINSVAKKISSSNFDSEIEIKFWEARRFGFKPSSKSKKPVPLGILLPLVSKIFLMGIQNFTWMASLVFDVKAKTYRAAKRHGLYSFSEMTEDEIGKIAVAGIIANLVFAAIGYLIGTPLFAKLNIYYAFFNMIPLSNLDGNKIFFGNKELWTFIAVLTLIGITYAILL